MSAASSTATPGGDVGSAQQTPPTPQLNRSCESCRSLKVRCLPDSASPNRCQRCAKAKRPCIFVAPQRRRPRKRTDSRVAQLEREMRQMRSLLKDRLQPGESSAESSGSEAEESGESDHKTEPQMTLSVITEAPSSTSGSTRPIDQPSPGIPAPYVYSYARDIALTSTSSNQPLAEHTPEIPPEDDVVERGVISFENAEKLVAFFVAEMTVFAPSILLHPHTTAAQLRSSKPVLFLSVLAAAAMSVDAALAATLNRELVRLYADKFFINGDKSLELVQALLLMIIYYYPPDSPLKLQHYQYIHIAATMALEVGLASKRRAPADTRDNNQAHGIFDEHMAEQARAILGCYHLASTVAMKTRRPNLLIWNEWLNECTKHLERSPHASDRQIAIWFDLQRMIDEAMASFGMDDTSSVTPLTDIRVQAILRWFDDKMHFWKKNLSPDMLTGKTSVQYGMTVDEGTLNNPFFISVPVLFEYHYTNLAIYELAIGEGYRDVDSTRQPFYTLPMLDDENQRANDPLSAVRIDITIKWMNSAQKLLDFFLEYDVDLLRRLPNLGYTRVGVAMMSLLKIHFYVQAGSLGEVVTPETVKVGLYLDAVIAKLTEASGEKKYRTPSRWLHVIGVKGRDWYERLQQKTQANESRGPQAPRSAPVNPPPNPFQTPQHLGLSADDSQIPHFQAMAGGYGPSTAMTPMWPPGPNYLNMQPIAGYQPPIPPSYVYGTSQQQRQQASPEGNQHHKPMGPSSSGMEVDGWVPDGSVYGMPSLPGF
ncbi:hypothetical protein FE257_004063 [Aspergillus nanangensis]|uniref:Zn(2)-C6 fungal-type domain-containing protein n=1 Tax=Aspergillus nanangensis TaxID=2582783 RepID=A0AAD4CC54_ASPNN|nr:hypothetical protein FE257_004063 [Aspergillus nanangensis]